ncbi:ABC transporter ATP-binding protein [Candidatus Woesearchaeota archaeon]|nr:ABC transporter ATP-binding protein [Candidatus Woesearchaeota archaeon]
MVDEFLEGDHETRLSRSEIRSLMLKAGWPSDLVQKYLSKAKPVEGAIIQVHGISKAFNGRNVLESVDFDVNRGEIFGIIGMSGAGKTTLLNLLVGFLRPDQGDVLFTLPSGSVISTVKQPDFVNKFFGFSTQTPSFYSKLTVLENLEYFGTLAGIPERKLRARAKQLLGLVQLSSAQDIAAEALSGGMQKRLDIACALINEPLVLILDEPTADLDPVMRKQLWQLIRDINESGTTVVLASHFLAEIEMLCDRIGIVQNHTIVEIGTADQLRSIYSRNFELRLESESHDYNSLVSALKGKPALFSKTKVDNDELIVETAFPEKILPFVSGFISKENNLRSLSIARPSLGKVFETLVKK